jgi:tRNA (cytidine/uridine-2'-O-)-methyltransferase
VQPTLTPLVAPLTLVLVSPQIPPNTGNVARLCACTGCKLVLVEPLGFSIGDKALKRAGLDYWDQVFLRLHPSWEAYLAATVGVRRFLFTARAATGLWQARFQPGDHLVFGPEPTGLDPAALTPEAGVPTAIPMLEDRRSLNLSTAVGVAAYEALRQLSG